MTRTSGLHVLNVLGCLVRGGAELRAVEIAEAFPPEQVRSDFLVLSGRDGVLDDRVRRAGGDVIKCPLDARFADRFVRLLRQGRYAVVHSHVHYFSGVVLALARMAGVPGRVAHLHTAVVNDRERSLRRTVQLAICRALLDRCATDIVAAGEGTMENAWGRGWQADPRCLVIYNGIRRERLALARRPRCGPPTLVNVASIKPLKNQLRLVPIFRRIVDRVPEARLQLIGPEVCTDYAAAIRQAAAKAGIGDRVEFVGEVDEPIEWIANADAMVFPSLWEGLPCAVLEACAAGTPAAVSDLPGTREIARHFAALRVLSLEEPDERWAAEVASMIGQSSADRRESADYLARTPFTFEAAAAAYLQLWGKFDVAA